MFSILSAYSKKYFEIILKKVSKIFVLEL